MIAGAGEAFAERHFAGVVLGTCATRASTRGRNR